MKLGWTSSDSDVTDTATRVYDRRLTGSASASALGYFESAASDDIWYSGESSSMSSTHNITSSTATTSSSSAPLPHSADLSPVVEQRQQLHRSSPLAALNNIYVIDHHVTGNRSPAWSGGGVVNDGFVGDGILTDSWRRVSWRARLRAGIARSTVSSDQASPTSNQAGNVSSRARHRPSYLSDVIDSVTFFSNAGGSASTHARYESPLSSVSVQRCQSDGGEWTLRRDRDRPLVHRPISLYNSRQRSRDHARRQAHVNTYYTYAEHARPSGDSTPNQRSVERR